ncbi:MAG: ABC transporter permease subunit, partial [Isosphaeraceae bacterium]|nr:ABC transporter permease subunit [Isosphaeraceae bacterium]
RQPRTYALRVAFGLALLVLLWVAYDGLSEMLARARTPTPLIGSAIIYRPGPPGSTVMPTRKPTLTPQDRYRFANWAFSALAVTQYLVVLVLMPALVAGSIAEDRQRRILQPLLATPLSPAAIVLGKLAARLLLIGLILLAGLPVLVLLNLVGYVEPGAIAVAYSFIFATTFFLGGLAMLISTVARQAREAVPIAYALVFAWLIYPLWADSLSHSVEPWRALRPILEVLQVGLVPTNPFWFRQELRRPRLIPAQTVALMLWSIGLLLAYGTVFLLLASWQLRRGVRDEEGRRRKRARVESCPRIRRWRWAGRLRLWPRSPCGDDPMLWKERFASRARGLAGLILPPAAVAFVGLSGATIYYASLPAFHEQASGREDYVLREHFNTVLRNNGCVIVYGTWMLGVATAAAVGVTSEKEGGTWVSLLASPLTGREVVRAKILGAAWRNRWVGFLLIAMWLTGLASGAVHPAGVALALGGLVAFTGFAAALGTWISLRRPSSSKALAAMALTLILLNGALPLFGMIPGDPWPSRALRPLCSPFLEGYMLVTPRQYQLLCQDENPSMVRRGDFISYPSDSATGFLTTCALGLALHALAALAFTRLAMREYDRQSGRGAHHKASGWPGKVFVPRRGRGAYPPGP